MKLINTDKKCWDKEWLLVEGCTPVSQSQYCKECRFATNNEIFTHKSRLSLPIKVEHPTTWTVWSDLFHEQVEPSLITIAFEVMEFCKQHTFIVCTKRPYRIEPILYGMEGNFFLGGGDYIPNVFLGTVVESQDEADKVLPLLIKCKPFKIFYKVYATSTIVVKREVQQEFDLIL